MCVLACVCRSRSTHIDSQWNSYQASEKTKNGQYWCTHMQMHFDKHYSIIYYNAHDITLLVTTSILSSEEMWTKCSYVCEMYIQSKNMLNCNFKWVLDTWYVQFPIDYFINDSSQSQSQSQIIVCAPNLSGIHSIHSCAWREVVISTRYEFDRFDLTCSSRTSSVFSRCVSVNCFVSVCSHFL